MTPIGLLLLLYLYIGWRIAPQLPGNAAGPVFALLLAACAVLIPLAFFGRRARQRKRADRWTWARRPDGEGALCARGRRACQRAAG